MHSLLSNLPPLGALGADELAQSAVAIYRKLPPKQLLRRHRLRLVTCATASCTCMWRATLGQFQPGVYCAATISPQLFGVKRRYVWSYQQSFDAAQVHGGRVHPGGQYLAGPRQACCRHRYCHGHLFLCPHDLLKGQLLAADKPSQGDTVRGQCIALRAAGMVGRDALHNLAAYFAPGGKRLRPRGGTLATAMGIMAAVTVGVGLQLVMMQYRSQLP